MSSAAALSGGAPAATPDPVKLVVWDLDDTLWEGILLEGDPVEPRAEVVAALRDLDERGILHSIASRNDPELAWERLRAFGLDEYFLYPEIGWGAKSESVERIARRLDLGLDAVAFVDDQPFERDEVVSALPAVRAYSADRVAELAGRPEFRPRFVTDESKLRRRMYRAEVVRRGEEETHQGPREEFLLGLGLRMAIAPARGADLQRAEELTVRTHQLNTTGYTYSYEELERILRSPEHLLLTARLEDRYGTYGTIGLALVERSAQSWMLKLLLMSCRVMSRGVGGVLLLHVMERARRAGVPLFAEYRPNGRNRQMLVTYKFTGFRTLATLADGTQRLEADLERAHSYPDYVTVVVEDPAEGRSGDRVGSDHPRRFT